MTTDAPSLEVRATSLPFEEAAAYFRGKVPEHTQHWTDLWRTAHARSFMVAGAASDALLADFQQSIRKALEQGTTLAEFRRDFDRIVATHGWVHNGAPGWRARVIYETNLSTAYAAGRYAQLTEPETKKLYPFWQYVHSGSSHPRLQHLAWNGLTLSCDDPFWASHYPPNGWHCGCRVRPVSAGGLARMGKDGPDAAPPIQTRAWRNPHTGAVVQVPVGIDPGFDYNPGLAWKQTRPDDHEPSHLASPSAGATRPLTPTPKLPSDKQMDALRAFVAAPKGEVLAGYMGEDVQRLLDVASREVRLSADTMAKQDRRHGELSAEEYLLAPLLIAQPTVVLAKGDRRLALLHAGASVLVGILKADKPRQRTYLVSFHRAGTESLPRLLRGSRVLIGDAADVAARGTNH